MPQYTTLIVGAHFRPPAKQLLAVLPQGWPLRLEEDNENPYDAAAVKVMLDLTEEGSGASLLTGAQMAALEVELPNCGLTLEMLLSGGPIQLGFIPAQEGKPLAKARSAGEPELLGNLQVRELMGPYTTFALGFAPDGSIRIAIESPVTL